MYIKEKLQYSVLYLINALYPCFAAYILIFTVRPECITLIDHINSFLKEPEAIYIFTGLAIAFALNLLAFIALLKIPMSHIYFKYLLAYLWVLVVVTSMYWLDINILSILAAGVVSYGYYQADFGKNI
jgi:hypothetical protein